MSCGVSPVPLCRSIGCGCWQRGDVETTQPSASSQNQTQNCRGIAHISRPQVGHGHLLCTCTHMHMCKHIHVCAHTHMHTQVRYAAVIVLKEVYTKLGNEFMSLLPETVPFLAELLEGVCRNVYYGAYMYLIFMSRVSCHHLSFHSR